MDYLRAVIDGPLWFRYFTVIIIILLMSWTYIWNSKILPLVEVSKQVRTLTGSRTIRKNLSSRTIDYLHKLSQKNAEFIKSTRPFFFKIPSGYVFLPLNAFYVNADGVSGIQLDYKPKEVINEGYAIISSITKSNSTSGYHKWMVVFSPNNYGYDSIKDVTVIKDSGEKKYYSFSEGYGDIIYERYNPEDRVQLVNYSMPHWSFENNDKDHLMSTSVTRGYIVEKLGKDCFIKLKNIDIVDITDSRRLKIYPSEEITIEYGNQKYRLFPKQHNALTPLSLEKSYGSNLSLEQAHDIWTSLFAHGFITKTGIVLDKIEKITEAETAEHFYKLGVTKKQLFWLKRLYEENIKAKKWASKAKYVNQHYSFSIYNVSNDANQLLDIIPYPLDAHYLRLVQFFFDAHSLVCVKDE